MPVVTPTILKYDMDCPDRPWMVYERMEYADNSSIHIVVPKGFHTDLTSRLTWLPWGMLVALPFAYVWPVILWVISVLGIAVLLIRDPLGRHQIASIFHDQGYAEQRWPKYLVDAAYLMIMERSGVNWVRRYVNFFGVTIGGWPAWWSHRKKTRS